MHCYAEILIYLEVIILKLIWGRVHYSTHKITCCTPPTAESP